MDRRRAGQVWACRDTAQRCGGASLDRISRMLGNDQSCKMFAKTARRRKNGGVMMNRIPLPGCYEITYPSILRVRVAAARAVNEYLWSCDANRAGAVARACRHTCPEGRGAYHAIGLHPTVQKYFGIQIDQYFFR